MKITAFIFLLASFNFLYAIPPNIIIRKAIQKDLPALFDFDRTVSYEYFLPLYSTGYTHLPLGKDPTYFLELELENDKKWFPECINGNAESLWVACDQKNNSIAGLLVAHKSSAEKMELDLLLIVKEYRAKGIGKAFIHHAINVFSPITTCEVYPLRFANDETLGFYQALGFVNQGIPANDKVNIYGISYNDMYYYFMFDLSSQRPPTAKVTPTTPENSTRARGIR